MGIRFLYYLQILLFLTSCKSNAQVVDIVTGTITMTFAKDTIGYDRYWLKEKDFAGLYFEENAEGILPEIDFVCDSTIIVEIPKKRVRLHELPEYQSQSQENDDFYTHLGGDVFMTLNGEIILTFQMKAMVLKLEASPCDKFQLQSQYSCPVNREQIKYPIYVILDIISANSIKEPFLKKEGIIPLESKSFPVGVCD